MALPDKKRSAMAVGAVAVWLATATLAQAGAGNILKQVASPALTSQQVALANQVQTAQALQALKTATQSYQANGIRGGGVMINVSNNPAAVPSQIIASVHADGKIYVIYRNRLIFGGPPQINTHKLTGAAMGATSNSQADLPKFQRALTKPKDNPSLMKVDVLGYGGK